jgi:hypothetical protein
MTRHDLISVLRTPSEVDSELLARLLEEQIVADDATRLALPAFSPRTQIFNDTPTEVDTFGFMPFVRTLSNIILAETTQTPLTICIDGEWGVGKTSIMQMIAKQASLVGLPSVWLNAWSLEDTSNLISSVSGDIQREAERWEELEWRWYKPWKRLIVSLARTFLRMSGTGGSLLAELADIRGDTSERAKEVASVVTAQRSFQELVEVLLRAVEDAPAPNDPEAHGPTVRPRLIVFIDDIDRALPDQIVTTLKTLRLVLDNKHCVFILGMDFELVARSLANFYSGRAGQVVTPEEFNLQKDFTFPGKTEYATNSVSVDFGRCYLEKLIQLHVKVPGLTRERVEEYLQGLSLAPEVIEIVRWSPDQEALNPRRLKRYINWLSITLQLIKDSKLPTHVSNLTALRILAFRRGYPELYKEAVSVHWYPSQEREEQRLSELIVGRRHTADGAERDSAQELQSYLRSFIKHVPAFEHSLVESPLLLSTVGDAHSQLSTIGYTDKDNYPPA